MSTRPPAQELETRRVREQMVAAAGNDVEWRIQQAEAMAEIRVTTRWTQQRLEDHMEEDRKRFEALEGNDRAASVRIGKYETDKAQVVGVNQFLTKLFAIFGGGGALILFIIAIYQFIKGAH